jgi:DNA repair protein RecN (Recombination protein N)
MLLSLHISDFAIIDSLDLHFGDGFNVLTGETGAGKSIIIDALGMLRGEKPDPTMVRSGSGRARVEGVFSLEHAPDVVALLQQYDLWSEEDEQVILTREISAESGRSMARINRRAVNTAVLREIGSRLVDIHGQHEGLSIFNTRTHLDMLDRYGGLLPLREQVSEHIGRLDTLRAELAELRRSQSQRQQRIEELHLLLEDVSAANLRADEEQELLQERQVVQNAVRITELVTAIYAALYQGNDESSFPGQPVVAAMGSIGDNLTELARFDPSVGPLAEQAASLHYHLEDLALNVREYRDNLDFDPRRLDDIEERLTLLRALQRKHGGTIAELIERAAKAEAEIERLTHSSEHIAELEAQESRLRVEIGALASELSRRRRGTAQTLSSLIEGARKDLAMPRVQFAVHVEQRHDPAGVPVQLDPQPDQQPAKSKSKSKAGERPQPTLYACDRTGIDQLEFMISPNPGEPLKPLARIASGGESARLLLALKSILSRADSIPSMVFDEIDVGVGGRAGQVVGQKLWGITANHQVLCITHLPQVAAFADTHFAISKELVENSHTSELRTRTNVRNLTLDQRIDELAAMLDGTPVSEHSRASAREIIERASAMKQAEREQRATEPDQQPASYAASPVS